ncbi:hypothetical protein DFH06DRAFT_1323741 [Mycena polygramma]|nr:hypothetical protein DFH06DRAFT_1323741 [Mycena polygramma]
MRVPVPAPAPAHELTPAEIAALMGPDNHPQPLSADELERLTAHLTEAQLEEVINLLGLGDLARQLPPVLLKIMRVAKHIASARPPEYDDDVDRLARNLDLVAIAEALDISPEAETATPPPSSPEVPQTPVKPVTAKSAPSTPRATARGRTYAVDSPTKVGSTVCWLEAGALTQGVSGASVRATGKSHPRSRKKSEAYVVFYGGKIDVFTVWADVQRSITGNGLAIQCGFPTEEAAHAALAYARSKGWTGDSAVPPAPTGARVPATRNHYEENPLTCGSNGLWYVVCRGVEPGIYRSHLECSLNVTGVRGSLFRAFETAEEAEAAFASAVKTKWNTPKHSPTMLPLYLEPMAAQLQPAIDSFLGLFAMTNSSAEVRVTNSTLTATITSLNFISLACPMPRKTTKARNDPELLDGAALRAWRYRQRHRDSVNEKAKARMRQKREQLKSAPSAVQHEYNHRAEQYRQNYLQRTKQPVKKPPVAPKLPAKKSTPAKSPAKIPPTLPPTAPHNTAAKAPALPATSSPVSPVTAPRVGGPGGLFGPVVAPLGYSRPRAVTSFTRVCLFDVGPCPASLKIIPTNGVPARRRAPNSPTPLSLADIDAARNSDDDEGASESDAGWEGDNEREGPGAVSIPRLDYVGWGKEPYIRNDRRIWL